jgi:hypothetical protein
MQYEKSVVTFLDILGFQSTVKSQSAGEVHRILTALRSHAKPEDKSAQQFEMHFVTFSDCTIRTTPLEGKSNKAYPLGLLYHELLELVHAQYRLLCDGYFMRGGITVGDIFVDDRTIFGPAMNSAYKLESEFAKYPRIVLDPTLLQEFEREPLLRNHKHDIPTEKKYLRDLVKQDADGLYFLDYLTGMNGEFDDVGYEPTFWMQHKGSGHRIGEEFWVARSCLREISVGGAVSQRFHLQIQRKRFSKAEAGSPGFLDFCQGTAAALRTVIGSSRWHKMEVIR